MSTDNTKAMFFYERLGLQIDRLYVTEDKNVEFATYRTPERFFYQPPSQKLNIVEEEKNISVLSKKNKCIINETKDQNCLRIDTEELINKKRSNSVGKVII